MTPSTPKTHVLLARAAPLGAVFYRKSSLTTYLLSLDCGRRSNGYKDRLSKGSRIYGRLFPERSDLSPDGGLLVYFAMRGRKTGESSTPSTWTAVSTPPWLKAHLFFGNGSTWGGGGYFLRDHRLVVFESLPPDAGPEYSRFRGYDIVHGTKSLLARETELLRNRYHVADSTEFPAPSGKRNLVLVRRRRRRFGGSYGLYDYALVDGTGKDVPGAEELIVADWAGWNLHGRLLAAQGRYLKFYELERKGRFGKPAKILDIEAAITDAA